MQQADSRLRSRYNEKNNHPFGHDTFCDGGMADNAYGNANVDTINRRYVNRMCNGSQLPAKRISRIWNMLSKFQLYAAYNYSAIINGNNFYGFNDNTRNVVLWSDFQHQRIGKHKRHRFGDSSTITADRSNGNSTVSYAKWTRAKPARAKGSFGRHWHNGKRQNCGSVMASIPYRH